MLPRRQIGWPMISDVGGGVTCVAHLDQSRLPGSNRTLSDSPSVHRPPRPTRLQPSSAAVAAMNRRPAATACNPSPPAAVAAPNRRSELKGVRVLPSLSACCCLPVDLPSIAVVVVRSSHQWLDDGQEKRPWGRRCSRRDGDLRRWVCPKKSGLDDARGKICH
ncbi:hypothetical protein ACLOJK_000915 [Asimina triloba]